MKITREQLDKVLDEILEDNDDFVYESPVENGACKYMDEGSPSCIIGHALVKLGVPTDYLEDMDEDENLAKVLNVWSDEQVAKFAQMIQDRQDNGTPWGVAVFEARMLMETFNFGAKND